MTPSAPRVAVVFHRFGPYHVARLAAAGARGPLVGVELSARGGEYAWDAVPGSDRFRRVTLAADADALPAAERAARLARALDDVRPDVVFANGWADPTLPGLLRWCWRQRVPSAVMSESAVGDEHRRRWKEAVKRRVVRCFSAALVGGIRHAEYAAALGVPEGRIFRGYDAVHNAYFEAGAAAARADALAVRGRLRLPDRYFLASNRFVPKKNLPRLLAAFAAYRAAAGPAAWDLVLLGDGPLRPEVERTRAELGLTVSVHLPGFKQYGELPAYYALAGAFVHASTSEQWGLVVNEAMASGLPVIVSDRCGCAPDLVDPGATGWTFDPEDAAALAGLMGQVAADAAGRAAVGAAARERVRAFGPEAFADGLWAAAAAALAAPRPRPGAGGRLAVAVLGRQ